MTMGLAVGTALVVALGIPITGLLSALIIGTLVYWASDAVGDLFSDIEHELYLGLPQLTGALLEVVQRDPLVLDLDGDGIELVSRAASNTHFDYDKDGFAERTDGCLQMMRFWPLTPMATA
jgi:hypothetical protein